MTELNNIIILAQKIAHESDPKKQLATLEALRRMVSSAIVRLRVETKK